MDTTKILSAILFLGVTANASAQIYIPDTRHVNIGVVYPVSSNGRQAQAYTNCFSLNLLAGLSNAETGLSLAGLSNIIFDSASGVQIAGLSNHIAHRATGVQIAGLANSAGCNTGTQVAGFGNFVPGNSRGVQVAGFANVTGGNGSVQVAGFGNLSGCSSGVQVSGFINKARNVNTQVGGFINVAKKVKGVQIAGFINIADSSDYPIAVLNFVRNGEKALGVTTDETLTTLLSFRSGGRKLYGIAGLGYNHKGERELAAWEAGLGAHLVSTQRFRLNVEAAEVGLTDFKHGDWMKSSLRVLPVYRLGHRVELFAGPSFNYVHAKNGQGEDIVGHYLWSDRNSRSYHGLFFGVTGGIQVGL